MANMFYVRSSPCPAPNLQSSPPRHPACIAVARRLPPPSPRKPHLTIYPLCDSAEHALPVQRQQAAHPLRVGGQPGLPLRHAVGPGKLLAELSPHRGA
eukprot:scaffold39537_cov51-Phaeocystis_antarctica.AAC.3